MSSSQIDVLIPVYNAAGTVAQAIGTIQQQSVRDIIIHVVDDGSTDGTPGILAGIAAQDSRVVVHTQKNGGIVDALNNGLTHCTAEFIARHDADDLAYPDRLERQRAFLQSHPDVVAVGAAARHIDETDRPIGSVARMPNEPGDPLWVPSRNIYLIHPFLMVRRQSIEQVGGYRHVHHAEDVDLYWRLLDVGKLYNMPEVLGDYRMHAGSISGSSIVNGRIMAISSELSALSERRRRDGLSDYVFHKEDLHAFKTARTIQGMMDLAAPHLNADERSLLELAVAAKLYELTGYRPYDLDIDDCRFIRRAIRENAHRVTAANRRKLSRATSGTAARLAKNGRFREMLILTPVMQYPGALARWGLRVGMPATARRRLRYLLTGTPGK